jgi:Zn-finger protein
LLDISIIGLGYDHAHIIKGSGPITQIDIEDDMSSDDTSKESAHPPKKMYQIKREDLTINKGKDSPQSSDCNNVDIEFSPVSREEDSNTITECFVSIYPMEEEEEKLSKAKEKVDWSLSEYLYHHNESYYSYLHDYTQEFLEKSQKHVLKIKEMLKDSKKIIYEQEIS